MKSQGLEKKKQEEKVGKVIGKALKEDSLLNDKAKGILVQSFGYDKMVCFLE
jgi:hypothetical protein